MKVWALTDGPVREGKYLVVRRDGTIPPWPHFVIAAADPCAPDALRAYAAKAGELGLEPEYVRSVDELADHFERYSENFTVKSDPDAGPHRKDNAAVIAMMRGEGDLAALAAPTEQLRALVEEGDALRLDLAKALAWASNDSAVLIARAGLMLSRFNNALQSLAASPSPPVGGGETIGNAAPSPNPAESAAPPQPLTEDQIKHMVSRFLGWRLPEDFRPDAGITFKPTFNEHTAHPTRHNPVGTNLLDAGQAEAMVRYMLEGLPDAPDVARAPASQAPVGDGSAHTTTTSAEVAILETEDDGRYEARAVIGGRLYSKVVYRDPRSGWPYDYRQKAHDEIKRQALSPPDPGGRNPT